MKADDDRHRSPPPTDDPADVLGDVWEALDLLPRSTMPASMAATTIEMAAVSARARTAAVSRSPGAWLLAAVAVAGCFAIGMVAGRMSLPRPEPRTPPRMPAREIIEAEAAKQRRQAVERFRDQRRPPRPPAEIPAPPR